MDGWLKQSIAITLRIGPFLDSADGNTQETALTIAQADIVLSKAGGALAAKNDATSCTHDSKGYYSCPLDATDTGTLGLLKLAVHVAGALAVWHTFMVVPVQVWDSLFGADRLQVHADEITADLITATAIAADAIGSSELAQAAADKVWATGTRALTDKAGFSISGTKQTLDALNDITAASVWDVATRALTDKADFALSAASRTAVANDVWGKTGAVTSIAVELLLERLYEMVNNKMIVTESSGAVALRNFADTVDVANGNVQDLGATTQRDGLTWV